MAMTEPGTSAPASPSDVGRHLRAVRKARGLSRAEVARSAGLTRRELAAYERGRSPVPDSDLWCLAGSCGVDIGELLPPAERLTLGSDLGALTVGESVARLRPGPGNDGVLREYLAMVYELRNLPPGARPPMRDEDLARLADALGGTPDAIEARLHELIGASREEAARLRGMILPPRPIAAPAAQTMPPLGDLAAVPAPPIAVPAAVGAMTPGTHGGGAAAVPGAPPMAPPEPVIPTAIPMPPADLPPLATGGTDPPPAAFAPPAPAVATPGIAFAPPAPVATPTAVPPPMPAAPDLGLPAYPAPAFDFAAPASSIGDAAAADRFFSAPHAEDPFAPPPPLESLVPPVGAFPPVADPGFPPPAPFATPVDAFAPPTGPPLASTPGAPPVVGDPFAPAPAEPVRPDGFVADLGTDLPDATVPAFGAAPDPLDDPLHDPLDDPLHDPFAPAATDGPRGSFGGVEMVVLDVGPGGAVIDPLTPAPTSGDGPTTDVDDEADDPFAILRIPIDEALPEPELDSGPGWAEVLGPDTPDAAAPAPYVDAFTDAFTPPADTPIGLDPAVGTPAPAVEPAAEPGPDFVVAADAAPVVDPGLARPVADDLGDDDPGDDWFDRAAAAADALIAEQRHDVPSSLADSLAAAAAATVVDELPATIADPAPDRPADADLAPIAWSLTPPADAPIAVHPPLDEAIAPTEQFVAAGPDWQVGGIFPATAMADDGTLALRRADVRWALADLTAEGDFTIRATATFTSGAGFGILFRVSSDESERITGYSFDVDPIYSGGGFLVRQWNDSRQHWKPLAHAPVADTARLYGAHEIEVSLRNDTLTASIDGETVLHVAQLSQVSIDAGHEPCRGGRIGVQAWSTTEVTVDKLLVARH